MEFSEYTKKTYSEWKKNFHKQLICDKNAVKLAQFKHSKEE